ncbi:uncharacterized protein LOC106157742 [Lingula anatina]|uniref:Uncharacterized protein LOC106157742 n=1 Tax=Lingula anatina TaxID=7574 RepID=A0A1S3HV50_LINAN|nr:uncharacterized protein LOC106157742 [Lingula anatina]|eukprot:XP_013388934.1 uncharacterized protein LOC106157742 [Lingula anatina]
MDPERHASVWCTSIQSIGFSPDKGADAGNVTTRNNVLNCSRYQEYVHEQPRINSSSETEVVNVIEPKCCFSCETQASSKPGIENFYLGSSKPKEMTAMDTDDLSQLVGALNEDAVIKLLQSRFKKGLYFTKVGPVLLLVNPCDTVLPPHPLACSTIRGQEYLKEMVTTAAAQLAETAHTQVITLR